MSKNKIVCLSDFLISQFEDKIIATIIIFLFAFIVRSLILVFVSGQDMPFTGDEPDYYNVALSLSQGNGFPHTNRPPFISIVLAIAYFLFGDSISISRWLMVLVSSLTPVFVFFVARKISKDNTSIAILSAAVWIVYPVSVYYSSFVYTENIACLICLVVVLFYFQSCQSNLKWKCIFLGILMGVLALTRSTFLLIPVVLFLFDQVRRVKNGNVLSNRKWLLVFFGFILIMSPWWIRNAIKHKAFVPTTIRLGSGLYFCNGHLDEDAIQVGAYYKLSEQYATKYAKEYQYLNSDAYKNLPPLERSNRLKDLAIKEITQNWRKLLHPVINRAKNFWTFRPDPYDKHFTRNDIIMLITWFPILILFIISFWQFPFYRDWPVLIMILYAFIFVLPFWGTPRFRFPVDAFIVIRAVIVFCQIPFFSKILCRE